MYSLWPSIKFWTSVAWPLLHYQRRKRSIKQLPPPPPVKQTNSEKEYHLVLFWCSSFHLSLLLISSTLHRTVGKMKGDTGTGCELDMNTIFLLCVSVSVDVFFFVPDRTNNFLLVPLKTKNWKRLRGFFFLQKNYYYTFCLFHHRLNSFYLLWIVSAGSYLLLNE